MAELTYHQKKYPHLYYSSPMGGISSLLKSDFAPGGRKGPKITYGGATGSGPDPLGLMMHGGKGTGLDLITGPVQLVETEEKVPVKPTGAEDRGMVIPTSLADVRPEGTTMPGSGYQAGAAYVEEEDEEDRPKGLFSFLDGVELDGDALIKAGRAIEKGEGLGGAIEAYSDELAANEAARVAAEDKKYDRDRQARLDELDMAVQQTEIEYKQSQMTTDDQKLAKDAAIAEAVAQKIPLDSLQFAEILSNKLDMILEGKKNEGYTDIKGLQNALILDNFGIPQFGNPIDQAALNAAQGGGGLQGGGTVTIDGTQGSSFYNTTTK